MKPKVVSVIAVMSFERFQLSEVESRDWI